MIRTFVTLSETALKNNLDIIRSKVKKNTLVFPVVKANAYGHGLLDFSQLCFQMNVDGLCVASLEEALQIRSRITKLSILSFGTFEFKDLHEAHAKQITLSIHNHQELDDVLNSNLPLRVHLKFDTGMHRLGFQASHADQIIEKIAVSKLHLEGIYSHFSEAGAIDPRYSLEQIECFKKISAFAEKFLNKKLIKHMANSDAIFCLPQSHFDMVRPGLACYGYLDKQKTLPSEPKLIPVLDWKARLIGIQSLKEGASVGYSRAYKAPRDMTIGIVSVGYGDGYSRVFESLFMIHKELQFPIVGRICMDVCMIDLTQYSNMPLGTELSLIQKSDVLNAQILANASTKITYEVLSQISHRVLRKVAQ